MTIKAASSRSPLQSLQEYGRGVAGGLIFSLPLLYTMEMWWQGFSAHPSRLLLYVFATFGLLLGYNRFAGLRHDATFAEVVIDSVEELGLGLALSGAILLLLGRISPGQPFNEIIGQIVIEAMPVAIGISVGTAQLGGGQGDAQNDGGSEGDESESAFGQIAIALCGAVLFAFNVAPTEEIILLAVESSPWHLLAMALVSLFLAALILHFSEFHGAERFAETSGALDVVVSVAITYATALVASAALLWFFGRFDGAALPVCVAQTVVLGVAGTIGASAGRLLLQTGRGNEGQ